MAWRSSRKTDSRDKCRNPSTPLPPRQLLKVAVGPNTGEMWIAVG